jgi:hypothetical protein
MNASDKIALLALAVALLSLWFSYRTHNTAKRLTAAEKRTEVHSILVGVLIEAQELRYCIQAGVSNKSIEQSLREKLMALEGQLSQMVSMLEERVAWVRSKISDDPLILEEYKTYALEVAARVKQAAPGIKSMELPIKSFWETEEFS